MIRKLCVVTGSRAEYGLFYPLLMEIRNKDFCKLQIVVTGMHLSKAYGFTCKEILDDGFRINDRVRIPLHDNTPGGVTKAVGSGIIGFADVFKRIRPDFIILIGDRFETYAAAVAAFFAQIPIIHIHGGELTEGAIDDALRHSITKMSILHFTSTEGYRRRVIQLGENPDKVFNVGALGVDNIKHLKLLARDELEDALKFSMDGKLILVTFHPVTLEPNTSRNQFEEILSALRSVKGLKVVFTKPNSDMNGKIISDCIDRFVKNNPGRAVAFDSLGRIKYLSLLKYTDVMLGNSSSGIIEMPYFGKPTINIGDRQKGRIIADSVIQSGPTKAAVLKSLKKAFSSEFRQKCRKVSSPYGSGVAARRIVVILKKEMPKVKTLKKSFYDFRA